LSRKTDALNAPARLDGITWYGHVDVVDGESSTDTDETLTDPPLVGKVIDDATPPIEAKSLVLATPFQSPPALHGGDEDRSGSDRSNGDLTCREERSALSSV